MPMPVPINPERMIVRQYWVTSREFRNHGVEGVDDRLARRLAHHADDFGETEGADQCRHQRDAAGQVVKSECVAIIRIERFLTDIGDEQAEEAGHPAFERVIAGEISGDHDAEYREPEKFDRRRI